MPFWLWKRATKPARHPIPVTFPSTNPFNRGGDVLVPDEYHEGTVTGYRWWRVVNDGKGLCLASLHFQFVWGEHTRADCRASTWGGHVVDAPHPDCSCGLYAQRPDIILSEWERMTRGCVSASGSISMSGRIVVCTKGYKAQHASIDSPVLVDVACQRGCDNEPARVSIGGGWQTYASWCEDHAPSIMDEVTVDAKVWLRHAVAELSARYPNVEFISTALLEEI